jgi:SAM-dependent methyltransferase
MAVERPIDARTRSSAWSLLDNPFLWEASRAALDAGFGLYRRRLAVLRRWGVLDGSPSVLDVGCGIGQYAAITDGPYVGVELNPRYVEHARRRRAGPNRDFRVQDVTQLSVAEDERFDLVLMVDFLHHLAREDCLELLRASGRLSAANVVSLEPVREQYNRFGQWIVDHDRGDHMRSLDRLHGLFDQAGLELRRSGELMLGPIRTTAILASPAGGTVSS